MACNFSERRTARMGRRHVLLYLALRAPLSLLVHSREGAETTVRWPEPSFGTLDPPRAVRADVACGWLSHLPETVAVLTDCAARRTILARGCHDAANSTMLLPTGLGREPALAADRRARPWLFRCARARMRLARRRRARRSEYRRKAARPSSLRVGHHARGIPLVYGRVGIQGGLMGPTDVGEW